MAVHLGPRLLATRATEMSLLGRARRQWRAGKPNHDVFGPEIEVLHQLTGRLGLRGAVSWQQRDYRGSVWLDGPLTALSLGAVWAATPILRTRAGWGWGRERPQTWDWRNRSRWGRLGASLALPLGFTLGVGGELRWVDFHGDGRAHRTLDRKPRSDRTRVLRLSAFNRAFTLAGFSPQVVLVNEVRETNAQGQEYTRNRAELRFVRQF